MHTKNPSNRGQDDEAQSSAHPLRCLVLADFAAFPIGTVERHIAAFREFSAHEIQVAHVRALDFLRFDVNRFDVIVFHYSIVIAKGFHLSERLRAKCSTARGLKVLFIQDEYRWIDATAEAIGELGISVLFTVVNREVVERIYHHPWLKGVRKELTLTGFVDETLLGIEVPSYENRDVDVAYRARKVPYWLGSFAMEKWSIGRRFERDASRFQLACDISSDESGRLYGANWIRFLSGAKAVLGTESGASVCDFSGELRARVEAAVDRDKEIEFEAIRQEILGESDGPIVIHVVSPRMFEAAALRTLMINYPGEYSGCLTPWRHYVPLEKDHSNIAEVVAVIRDPGRAKQIIDAAYREVACDSKNSFRAMAGHFDRVVAEELGMIVPAGGNVPASRRKWYLLEVACWIHFYAWPVLIGIRILGVRVRCYVWALVRDFVPLQVRDWVKAKLPR
jgi:hypothetical protein